LSVTAVDIFAISCLFFLGSYLAYIIYYAIGLYDLNPFLRPKSLSDSEMHYLRNEIPGIKTLQPEKLKKFYNRVAWFRTKKTFSHKGSTPDARKLELLLSATAILLTIGLRKYKYFRTVNKIIIYPTDYYSVLHKRQHLGEFNFGLKTLVFAADSVVEGF
jgi:hypothetical protein